MSPLLRGRCSARSGHSLVELLVVGGIVAMLTAVLAPTISAARSRARVVTCINNTRQITASLLAYADAWNGRCPPNFSSPAPGKFWYDGERVVPYLGSTVGALGRASGGIMVCPEDDGVRSYAMNVWASSQVDPNVLKPPAPLKPTGTLWTPMSADRSRLILVTEAWSGSRAATTGSDWTAAATVGFAGSSPGQKFGAGTGWSGIAPPVNVGRIGPVNCELPFQRHRGPKGDGKGKEAKGAVVIGYADGHVSLVTSGELIDQQTGKSTLQSMWSPKDRSINN